MASVAAIANLEVSIGRAIGGIFPEQLPSSPIGITTHTHTQHFIKARAGKEIAVAFKYDLSLLNPQNLAQTFPGKYVEFKVRIDGDVVSHTRMHMNKIAKKHGKVWVDSFHAPNNRGSPFKRAEFRRIGKATDTTGEDHTTLLRAQQVGKIEVEVSHGNGVAVRHAGAPPFVPQHVDGYSSDILKQINGTHFVHYGAPTSPTPDTVVFENCTPTGSVGYYTFFYGSTTTIEPIEAQLNPGITNANANDNVNSNANTNQTSTTNPPNPSGSKNPHATLPAYPTYGSDAHGHSIPSTAGQGAPLRLMGQAHGEDSAYFDADRSADTRPGISSPAISAETPLARLAPRGGAARGSVPNRRTGARASGRTDAGLNVLHAQLAQMRGATRPSVSNATSGATESQNAASQNTSLAQRGGVTRPSIVNATSAAAESQIATQQYISQAQTPAGMVRGHGSSVPSYQRQRQLLLFNNSFTLPTGTTRTPTSNAISRRPAGLRPATGNFYANTTPADDQDDSSSSEDAEFLIAAGFVTASAPQNAYHRFATHADLNHTAFAGDMAAGLPASVAPPDARGVAFRAAMATYAHFRDGDLFFFAGSTTASQHHFTDAVGSNDNTTTLASQDRSRHTPAPFPLSVRERDARALAENSALRFLRAYWVGRVAARRAATEGRQDGNSSSAAGPTLASQGNVIDRTREDADAGSRNSITTSVPQTGYRLDAASPAPVDGGQSFMARAVAARDASMTAAREARVNAATLASNAAVLAAFGVGQGGSGSGNSSSSARPTAASQRHVTGEDADAGSRHDITNTSALQTGVRRGAPPPPAPADGGQSFMARAVAAREAAPRDPTMIADLIAAFTDCQDDSSSYSSSSSAS